jgi:hypothetical protein
MRVGLGVALAMVAAPAAYARLPFAGADPDVSGAYVVKYPNGAEMLRIVEAKGGSITGSLSGIFVDDAGEIREEQGTLAGSVEGNAIALQVHGDGPLTLPGNLSGTVKGEHLTLLPKDRDGPALAGNRVPASTFGSIAATWRGVAQKRADALAAAAATAQKVEQEGAREAALIGSAKALGNEIDGMIGRSDEIAARSKKYEDDLHAFTGRMNALLNREKQIDGQAPSEDAKLRHSSVVADLGLVGLDRNLLRIQMETYTNQLGDALSQIQRNAARTLGDCDGLLSGTGTRAVALIHPDEIRTGCARAAAAMAAFQPRYDALVGFVAQLRQSIRTELDAQQEIVAQVQQSRPARGSAK